MVPRSFRYQVTALKLWRTANNEVVEPEKIHDSQLSPCQHDWWNPLINPSRADTIRRGMMYSSGPTMALGTYARADMDIFLAVKTQEEGAMSPLSMNVRSYADKALHAHAMEGGWFRVYAVLAVECWLLNAG